MRAPHSFTLGLTTALGLIAGISMQSLTAKAPPCNCLPCQSPANAQPVSKSIETGVVGAIAQGSQEGTNSAPMAAGPGNSDRESSTGKAGWELGMKQAAAAVKAGKNRDLASLKEAKSQWEEAIASLSQIPVSTALGKKATAKIVEYKKHLADITYRLEVAQSDFLQPIAQRSGLSNNVKITICHLTSRRCRRLRGDEIPRSAASLMKVPVAVALMQKLTEEKIRFDTPIYLDPRNFTEDASDLVVGQKYPIDRIMQEMIAKSSNIATNQLIDYLGWDYINKALRQRGFQQMQIKSKVVGDRIFPADIGTGKNTLTADELTEMMIQIYNREHLGDEILIHALEKQYDRALGFAGLQSAIGNWLGEKTGQTSLVLGTTLAMNLFGETYIITVIDDGAYSEPSIRNFVGEVAEYIFRNGHL